MQDGKEFFIPLSRESQWDYSYTGGFLDGQKNAAVEIAKELFTCGISPETIAKCSGLSLEHVLSLSCESDGGVELQFAGFEKLEQEITWAFYWDTCRSGMCPGEKIFQK